MGGEVWFDAGIGPSLSELAPYFRHYSPHTLTQLLLPHPRRLHGRLCNLWLVNASHSNGCNLIPPGATPVYSTEFSQTVTHPDTNAAQCCLTEVILRELVFPTRYGRNRLILVICKNIEIAELSMHLSQSFTSLLQII